MQPRLALIGLALVCSVAYLLWYCPNVAIGRRGIWCVAWLARRRAQKGEECPK